VQRTDYDCHFIADPSVYPHCVNGAGISTYDSIEHGPFDTQGDCLTYGCAAP
jgi:hypothetical protein